MNIAKHAAVWLLVFLLLFGFVSIFPQLKDRFHDNKDDENGDQSLAGISIQKLKGKYFIDLKRSLEEEQSNGGGESQVVLRRTVARTQSLDPCDTHAYVVQAETAAARPEDDWRYELVDFFYDSRICDRTIEELIREQWNIREDVHNFPITYRHRAERSRNEAERFRLDGNFAQSERALRRAISNLDTAEEMYRSDVKFRQGLGSSQYEKVLIEIEGTISNISLEINSVTDKPKHELVFIPAGYYNRTRLADRDGSVRVPSYWIDRYEVSNYQFAQAIPPSYDGRPIKPNAMPVVGIPLKQAIAYCRQLGLTLPTAAEVERAGLWSPRFGDKLRLPLTYPWGDGLDSGARVAEVVQVQRDPTGGSPYRILNLATNVAEWVAHDIEGTRHYVKGGDGADLSVLDLLSKREASELPLDKIGFRCVFRSNRSEDRPELQGRILLDERKF